MMKTYQNHAMTDAEARQALADACKQVETNLPLYTYQCQNHSSVNETGQAAGGAVPPAPPCFQYTPWSEKAHIFCRASP